MLVTPNKFNVKSNIVIPNGAPETLEHELWIRENCCACINVSDTECLSLNLSSVGFPSFWLPIHETGQWGYSPFYATAKIYDFYKSSDKPILIHCHACVNRSPAVAYVVLASEGYSDSEIQQQLSERVMIPLVYRNIRNGYIPSDIFTFLKARKQQPTYSLMGLLSFIKSPNLIYKKPATG